MADFKIGDLVFHKGARTDNPEYVVEGVAQEGTYLWLRHKTAHENGVNDFFVGIASVYAKVVPFFEPGKTYQRHVQWSIPAQLNDVTEHFTCDQVETNGDGSRVAFGQLTVAQAKSRWIILGQYDFKHWRVKL